MAGAAILKIAYGIQIQAENDPFLYTAERATEAISATTNAGSYLVDALPFCKRLVSYWAALLRKLIYGTAVKYVPEWFPGATFQREARIWKEYAMKMLYEPFNIVKRQLVRRYRDTKVRLE